MVAQRPRRVRLQDDAQARTQVHAKLAPNLTPDTGQNMTAQTDDEHLTAHLPEPSFVPLPDYRRYPEAEVLARGEAGYAEMNRRRTTRQF